MLQKLVIGSGRNVLQALSVRFALLVTLAFVGVSTLVSHRVGSLVAQVDALDALDASGSIQATAQPADSSIPFMQIRRDFAQLARGTEGLRRELDGLQLQVGLSVLVSFLLVLGYAEFISRRLAKLLAVLRAMAQGDLSGRLPPGSRDEVDAMAASINAVADAMSAAVASDTVDWDQLGRDARYAPYARVLIESASYGMMVTTPELIIEYANPQLASLFRQLSPEFGAVPADWIGADLRTLHPEFKQLSVRTAGRMMVPFETVLKIGKEQVDVALKPAFSSSGEYLGVLISCQLATERLATAERERSQTKALEAVLGEVSSNISALLISADSMKDLGHRMSLSSKETAAETDMVKEFTVEVDGNVTNAAALVAQGQEGIQRIAELSREASQVAAQSRERALGTAEQVSRLAESSQEITRVTRLIGQIASRTNLLALNASIEASTAGAAGKGFTVVAREVKELARQAADATVEINERVEAIQGDADRSLENINNMIETVKLIADLQDRILVEVGAEQGLTEEIRASVERVVFNTTEIRRIGEAVAAAAKLNISGAADSEQAAVALTAMAISLGDLTARFSDSNSGHVDLLRTAKLAAEATATEAELF